MPVTPLRETTLKVVVPAELLEEIALRVAEILSESGATSSPWMTRKEAAEYLHLPLSRVEKDRTIPCHRDGGRILYHRDELDAHFRRLPGCAGSVHHWHTSGMPPKSPRAAVTAGGVTQED